MSPENGKKIEIAEYKRPLYNGPYCGDATAFHAENGITNLLIVDGLGHGKQAEEAAVAAVNYVSNHWILDLPELFAECGNAIRDTRGVAMGIARINEITGELSYAGIGNPRAIIAGENVIRLTSTYGIVGSRYRKLNIEKAQLNQGDLVLLFTDGLKERVDISAYKYLLNDNLDYLAMKILQDWSIERDDAAILIYRFSSLRGSAS